MNLMTTLTVLMPTVAVVCLADARLKPSSGRDQIELGLVLLVLGGIPAVGLILTVPGGSLSEVPAALKPAVEYIGALALAPIIALLALSVLAIGRGVARVIRQRRSEPPANDR